MSTQPIVPHMTVTELFDLQRRDARPLWLMPVVCLGVLPGLGAGFLVFGPSLLDKFLVGLALIVQDFRVLTSTAIPLEAFLVGGLVLHFWAGAMARRLLEAALFVTPAVLQGQSADARARRGSHLAHIKGVLATANRTSRRFDLWLRGLGGLAVTWAGLTVGLGILHPWTGVAPWVNLAAGWLVTASLNWPQTWTSLNAVMTPEDLARAHSSDGPGTRYSVLDLPAVLRTHLTNRCAELEQERTDG